MEKINSAKRRSFTKEQRDQILYYYRNNIYSVDELSKMFGCSVTTIYSWANRYKSDKTDSKPLSDQDLKYIEMEKTIIAQREEIRILKKALSIVSQN